MMGILTGEEIQTNSQEQRLLTSAVGNSFKANNVWVFLNNSSSEWLHFQGPFEWTTIPTFLELTFI